MQRQPGSSRHGGSHHQSGRTVSLALLESLALPTVLLILPFSPASLASLAVAMPYVMLSAVILLLFGLIEWLTK